jgi:hypothetical protein
MARSKFGFGSQGARGREAVRKIVSALEEQGLQSSDKTVRDVLREAEQRIGNQGQ